MEWMGGDGGWGSVMAERDFGVEVDGDRQGA